MNFKLAKTIVAASIVASLLWASGVTPAIVPANVPVANKRGNSALFQLAGGAAPSTNDCAMFDANGNLVTAGTICGATTSNLSLFLQDTTIIPLSTDNANLMQTLLSDPGGGVETTDGVTISGTTTALIEGYLYTVPLGVTTIPAGVWQFNTYASLSSLTGTSAMLTNVMRARPEAPDTITITGAGTSRTATCTAVCAGTPFAVSKISTGGTIDSDSYLQTPLGWFRITARTSDTVVTITTLVTYSNETAVAFSVWFRLFQVTTGTIPQTAVALYTVISTQGAFTVLNGDQLGAMYWGSSTGAVPRTITLHHNGTTHYTHFHTPLGGGGAVTSVFGQTGVVDIPVTTTDIATPGANPPAGQTIWYTKGGKVCALDPSGTETCTGGGTAVTVAPPYITAGGTTYGPVFTLHAPSAAGWTWDNQGTSTVTAVNGSLAFDFQTTASTDNLRCYHRGLPASTGYTAYIGFSSIARGQGVAIGDGTKYIVTYWTPTGSLNAQNWNSATSVSGNYFTAFALSAVTAPLTWTRFQDSGGARTVSLSADGQNWNVINSQASATFLTETVFGFCQEINVPGSFRQTAVIVDLVTSAP